MGGQQYESIRKPGLRLEINAAQQDRLDDERLHRFTIARFRRSSGVDRPAANRCTNGAPAMGQNGQSPFLTKSATPPKRLKNEKTL